MHVGKLKPMKRTAILVDGGFFIRRIDHFQRKYFQGLNLTAEQLCQILNRVATQHVQSLSKPPKITQPHTLYRIYFYDCPPPTDQIRYPIPDKGHKTPGTWNTKKHPPYQLRSELHDRLRRNRKTALRLGTLSKQGEWQLNAPVLKELISGEKAWEDITKDDFHYEISQKMVDTKLGVDITSLALEKLVDAIVLVAGDSDFVPAAKLARKRGIDFLLDPMWGTATPGLTEHVDGVRSWDLVSMIETVSGTSPTTRPSWWKAETEAVEAEELAEAI